MLFEPEKVKREDPISATLRSLRDCTKESDAGYIALASELTALCADEKHGALARPTLELIQACRNLPNADFRRLTTLLNACRGTNPVPFVDAVSAANQVIQNPSKEYSQTLANLQAFRQEFLKQLWGPEIWQLPAARISRYDQEAAQSALVLMRIAYPFGTSIIDRELPYQHQNFSVPAHLEIPIWIQHRSRSSPAQAMHSIEQNGLILITPDVREGCSRIRFFEAGCRDRKVIVPEYQSTIIGSNNSATIGRVEIDPSTNAAAPSRIQVLDLPLKTEMALGVMIPDPGTEGPDGSRVAKFGWSRNSIQIIRKGDQIHIFDKGSLWDLKTLPGGRLAEYSPTMIDAEGKSGVSRIRPAPPKLLEDLSTLVRKLTSA